MPLPCSNMTSFLMQKGKQQATEFRAGREEKDIYIYRYMYNTNTLQMRENKKRERAKKKKQTNSSTTEALLIL